MRKRKIIQRSPFSKRIRELREARGIVQQELAEQLGISSATLSKWEQSETVPNIYRAQKIANLLGVRVEFLLEGEPDESGGILTRQALGQDGVSSIAPQAQQSEADCMGKPTPLGVG